MDNENKRNWLRNAIVTSVFTWLMCGVFVPFVLEDPLRIDILIEFFVINTILCIGIFWWTKERKESIDKN